MKPILALLAFILINPALSYAGPGEAGGGGFLDLKGSKAVTEIAGELSRQLRSLPTQSLTDSGAPAGWSAERIGHVLDHLRLNPSSESLHIESVGRLKILDYDRRKSQVVVLAGFYFLYERDLSKLPVANETTQEIKQKLLHEIAHLWGASEEEAEHFANLTMRRLRQDTVVCVIRNIYSDRIVAYSFGTNQYFFANAPAGASELNADILVESPFPPGAGSVRGIGNHYLTENEILIWAEDYLIVIKRLGDSKFSPTDRYYALATMIRGNSEDGNIGRPVKCQMGNPR